MPVFIWNNAGEWLFVSVKQLWINAMSSTCCDRSSEKSPTPKHPTGRAMRELKRRFHQPTDFTRKKSCFRIKTFQRFTVPFFQFRFVVPGVDLAWAAVHEQPDDALGFGSEMGRPRRQRIERQVAGRQSRIGAFQQSLAVLITMPGPTFRTRNRTAARNRVARSCSTFLPWPVNRWNRCPIETKSTINRQTQTRSNLIKVWQKSTSANCPVFKFAGGTIRPRLLGQKCQSVGLFLGRRPAADRNRIGPAHVVRHVLS